MICIPEEVKGWAIMELRVKIGGRELETMVMSKEEADQMYEDHIARGKSAIKVE
jgi:hypothetical protein